MKRGHHLMGEVSLLGLNEFGENEGLSPLYGAAIGGGVTGLSSIAMGHMLDPTWVPNRARNSFLIGLGVSAAMWFMKSTRHAAFGSAIGAFLASGMSWLEQATLGTVQVPAPVAAAAVAAVTGTPVAAGTAGARVHYLNGLGIAKAQQISGRGMGLPAIAPVSHAVGAVGVAGPSFAGSHIGNAPPVSLLGAPSQQGRQVSLLGGPQVHGLSAAYGATLLGGGR
jgi:hypothetical protein